MLSELRGLCRNDESDWLCTQATSALEFLQNAPEQDSRRLQALSSQGSLFHGLKYITEDIAADDKVNTADADADAEPPAVQRSSFAKRPTMRKNTQLQNNILN